MKKEDFINVQTSRASKSKSNNRRKSEGEYSAKKIENLNVDLDIV